MLKFKILAAAPLLASSAALAERPRDPWPMSDPQIWITARDYPAKEAKGAVEAITYELVVDRDGKIASCISTNSLAQFPPPEKRYAGFGDLTCKLLRQRATFVPAQADDGTAKEGQYGAVVLWSPNATNDGRMAFVTPQPPFAPPPPAPAPLSVKSVSEPKMPPRFEPKGVQPKGNPAAWVTQADYPQSLKNGESGTIRFRLTIAPDGRVSNCETTGSSGTLQLDETACRMMRVRARFTPAQDQNGRPVTGTYSNAIRFMAPPKPVEAKPQQPGKVVSSYVVELDGSKSQCQREVIEGGYSASGITSGPFQCPNFGITAPYLDSHQKPVRMKVRNTSITEVLPVN